MTPGRFDKNGIQRPAKFTIRQHKRETKIAAAAIAEIAKSPLTSRSSAVLGQLLELEDAIFCVRWNSSPTVNPSTYGPCPGCGGRGTTENKQKLAAYDRAYERWSSAVILGGCRNYGDRPERPERKDCSRCGGKGILFKKKAHP